MGEQQYIIFKTKPFEGYRMRERVFQGEMVVAVPEKKLREAKEGNKQLCVVDKTSKRLSYMIIDKNDRPLSSRQFKDKWGRRIPYTLCYFIWKPTIQRELF